MKATLRHQIYLPINFIMFMNKRLDKQLFFLAVLGLILGFIGLWHVNSAMQSSEQAFGGWKRAKDNFLLEVKKMSQTPDQSDQEKRLIRSIENSWKGYDAYFHNYVFARMLQTEQSMRQAKLWLFVCMLIFAALIIANLLVREKTNKRTGQVNPIAVDDNLNTQADKIKDDIRDLSALVGDPDTHLSNKDLPGL